MSLLKPLTLVALTLSALRLFAAPANADIYRWDTGELIPGTEGIEPGPGVQLDHRELGYARLWYLDLTNSNFAHSNLTRAALDGSALTGANFTGSRLEESNFTGARLTNADFTDAVVTGATFRDTTRFGFKQNQLYSTASYLTKNLSGIWLADNDLTGWDFSGQDLSHVRFSSNLQIDNQPDIFFSSELTNTNFRDAIIRGARFGSATSNGFTKEQLYSTASYQTKDLKEIALQQNDLSGWNFAAQDLAGANFDRATLINANFTGAFVVASNFFDTTSRGFTLTQLASTASYQAKDLQGIGLAFNDLSGWDFRQQNLEGSNFNRATLVNANLTGAFVAASNFAGTTSRGLTKDQLYTTASYQAKNLAAITSAGVRRVSD